MKTQNIRQKFVDYFQMAGHEHVASSSLMPDNDPTLLFTNAGMNQFKNVFLGHERRPYSRAVTVQKCVRAGGKHNDLENVGHTARHHTFFEMLGNFSFGDYFKEEAIRLAWRLLTQEYGFPKEKLYVTVFETDEEAANIWHRQEGVPKDRIFRFGEKDNFWRMGETGPCGPCSEIFFDHGLESTGVDLPPLHPDAGDRYVEIWNLVFMQFNEDARGQTPLPKPSVDTGSGLERMAAALQGRLSNFETDAFLPLIDVVSQRSGVSYEMDLKKRQKHPELERSCAAMRVIADHVRSCSFMMADGILPSNDGRGYVLRRILRRAVRYGRTLNEQVSFMQPVAQRLIEEMGSFYPELRQRKDLILTTLQDEENRFLKTLDQGLSILNQELGQLKKDQAVPGAAAFRLYDTYGFPLDLTELIARESGLQVDVAGFEAEMEKARAKAKASWKGKLDEARGVQMQLTQSVSQPTRFVGYDSLNSDASVLAVGSLDGATPKLVAGEKGFLILDRTPFYAEGGGQIADVGTISSENGTASVIGVSKVNDVYVHSVVVDGGEFNSGSTVKAAVQASQRRDTAANHSATHLLHAALRQVLGAHVGQAGSLVTADRLRFDFTHPKPLTSKEREQIENLVNDQISLGTEVSSRVMPMADAVAQGAIAMFGEKYGDQVRVIRMGDFSTELCGGTHVARLGDIRVFCLVSESGVSAGVRRIEAITGRAALEHLSRSARESEEVRQLLGVATPETSAIDAVKRLQQQVRELEKTLRQAKAGAVDVESLWSHAQHVANVGRVVLAQVAIDDREALAQVVDQIKAREGFGALALVGDGVDGFPLFVAVQEGVAKRVPAGQIVKMITAHTGGRGGGKPTFAQGSVVRLDTLPLAFTEVVKALQTS